MFETPKQDLHFDYSGVTDPAFWAWAERVDGDERVLTQLTVHLKHSDSEQTVRETPVEAYERACKENGLVSLQGQTIKDFSLQVWMPGEPKPREAYPSNEAYMNSKYITAPDSACAT